MTDTTIAETTKPANLPEKFWDDQTGQVRLDALVGSYLALEKKLSTMMPSPDTPEGKARLLQTMGVPDSPDGYTVDVSHGLFQADPEVNQRLHALGFTPEQVQAVYDLAAQKLVPAITEIACEYKADAEIQRLTDAFGGPDKWAEVSRQLLAYGKKNFPADVLASLASSYEGVMSMYRLMKSGETPSAAAAAAPNAVSDKDLQSMMRDPRYWQKKDPAFVAKVTDGFRQMYGG